jgi:cytochrome P450
VSSGAIRSACWSDSRRRATSFESAFREPTRSREPPDLVHQVLVTDHKAFHKGPTIQAARMLLGESLLTSEGERHLRQRRLIQPIFHHEKIATYAAAMVRRGEAVAATWVEGEELDLHAEMAGLTLAVVGETLFGADVDAERSATVRRALTDMLAMFDRVYSPVFRVLARLPTPAMRRYRRLERDLDRVIGELIAERRTSGVTGDDVLSLLLRARDDGSGMSDDQVRDEALTVVLAGHETTANALAWTWWLLSEHPEAEARLHAELDGTLGGRSPAVDDLERLRYAEMVLSESIRLRPPAWAIGRRAMRDVRIGGTDVPSGSIVVVSPWLLHHDPRWWPDPSVFRPSDDTRGKADRPRSAYLRSAAAAGLRRRAVRLDGGTLLLSTIAQRWCSAWYRPNRRGAGGGHLRPRHGLAMIPGAAMLDQPQVLGARLERRPELLDERSMNSSRYVESTADATA